MANWRPSWILKVKNKSNHQNNIKYEILDPKNPKNDVLWSIVGQTVEKIILDNHNFVFRAAILDFELS